MAAVGRVHMQVAVDLAVEFQCGLLEFHAEGHPEGEARRVVPPAVDGHGRAARIGVQGVDLGESFAGQVAGGRLDPVGFSKKVIHEVHVVDVQVQGRAAAPGVIQQPALPAPGGLAALPGKLCGEKPAVDAAENDVARFHIDRPEADALGDHKGAVISLERVEHLAPFRRGQGQRLFAEDMLACRRCFQDVFLVQVRG